MSIIEWGGSRFSSRGFNTQQSRHDRRRSFIRRIHCNLVTIVVTKKGKGALQNWMEDKATLMLIVDPKFSSFFLQYTTSFRCSCCPFAFTSTENSCSSRCTLEPGGEKVSKSAPYSNESNPIRFARLTLAHGHVVIPEWCVAHDSTPTLLHFLQSRPPKRQSNGWLSRVDSSLAIHR